MDLFSDNGLAHEIIPRWKDMRHQDIPAHDVILPVMSLPFALRSGTSNCLGHRSPTCKPGQIGFLPNCGHARQGA